MSKEKQNKKAKSKKEKKRLGIAKIIKAEVPAAIASTITPLLTTGAGVLLASIILLAVPALRGTAPFFFLLGIIITAYAIWKKADVIKRGYDEYLFKVVDYTYIVQALTKYRSPTGLLLLMKEEDNPDNGNMYHVAVSGKVKNLPPIDWIIRVYVPKGSEAAQYGDRKYFPTVYGYRIEGEDLQ